MRLFDISSKNSLAEVKMDILVSRPSRKPASTYLEFAENRIPQTTNIIWANAMKTVLQ